MDIYLCTTVRHLMLAVLRACNKKKQALIVVVVDQQNLKSNDFDTGHFPEYIRFKFINRRNVLNYVYSGGLGKLHKIYATLLLSCSKTMNNRTKALLLENTLNIKVSKSDDLFLFNDRNRLSRLFRTYYSSYQVIEDGLSNYSGWSLRIWQKLISSGNIDKRYIGDSEKCTAIYLLSPEKAPKLLFEKVKLIDFISEKAVKKYLFPLFKVKESEFESVDAIIATQPISIGDFSLSGSDLVAYKEMKACIELTGQSLAIKVHPREDVSRYEQVFKGAKFINSKIPLELVLFSNKSAVDIYSIYSTVGMGFEKFCNRYTLISDSEALNQNDIFNNWEKNHDVMIKRIKNIIR